MHYGQVMQSHVLHFFHLAAPDLLFGFGAPAEKRNIFEVIKEQPELGKRAVLMRKYGQEIIEATAGKKVHGTGAIPGGINRNLPIERRDHFLSTIDEMIEWVQDAVKLARDYTLEHEDVVAEFGSFPSNYMSLVRESDGALDLYHGNLRALSSTGDTIFDQVPYTTYHELIVEDVRSWSYMKFPYITELGPEAGWYRVGPLARMNTASFIDTPLADAALEGPEGGHKRHAEQLDAGEPLGAHDRGAALCRKDPGTPERSGPSGHRSDRHRRPARRRHRRYRGPARQSHPSLQGRRE